MNKVAKQREPDDPRLMSFYEAGRLMGGIHPNTIRQRKAGTEELTHVPGFGRRKLLVRSEVLALIDRNIAQGQAELRKHRKGLRLVSEAL